MKIKLAALFALMGWFAVIAQFVLALQQNTIPVSRSIIQFFSYFTILTNILVAVYFTSLVFSRSDNSGSINKPGTLTALTVYIFIVSCVYQIALRHTWNPQGFAMVIDELLHTIIPVLTVIFWVLYENKKQVRYGQIPKWCVYPLAYLIYTLIHGNISGFYPYPFVDVSNLGMTKVLINSIVLIVIFFIVAALFVFIGRSVIKKRN